MSADGHSRECQPVIPALGPFYAWSRDFAYLIIRASAGGMLLVHGLNKLAYGTIDTFAAAVLAMG